MTCGGGVDFDWDNISNSLIASNFFLCFDFNKEMTDGQI